MAGPTRRGTPTPENDDISTAHTHTVFRSLELRSLVDSQLHMRGSSRAETVCIVLAVTVCALRVSLVATRCYFLEGFHSIIKLFKWLSAV
jgi:hypothetical protein